MFREEKLPVAVQSPPMPQRFVELWLVTAGHIRTLDWTQGELSAACEHELGADGGSTIDSVTSDGRIVWRSAPGYGDMIAGAVRVLQRYGWQLDSEWTDSIGRHARMVTTQPRQE